mgnify:CR=1 FL=1
MGGSSTPRGRYLSPFDRTRLHDFVQDLMGNKILGFISGVVKETNKKVDFICPFA